MRKVKKMLMLVLAVLMLMQCALPAGAVNKYFPDVKSGMWYEDELNKIMDAQASLGIYNIINGMKDADGVTRFHPEDNLLRGEFLKMIIEAEMTVGMFLYTTDTSRDKIHWAGRYYTLALENNLLVADVYSSTEPIFPCTFEALDKPITRYEMAVILNNIETNVGMKQTVIVNNPEKHITDYASIPSQYRTAVEQVYGKGLITGYTDKSFGGDRSLQRAEGLVIAYRYLFGCEPGDFAETPELEDTPNAAPPGFVSFAQRYATMTEAERRTALFGNPNKTYFSSAADAEGYMTSVTIPIWTMDKTGNKFSSSMSVTVHKLVADEIRYIFQEIYDDPERFPIYGGWSVGGARFTDTMRHSWGCAIDINALYNCECYYYHWTNTLQVTCGYGWWPVGSSDSRFAGSMTAPSAYSISADSSVVRAFAKYGWGWGGNGWGVNSQGREKFDYMHFSILASGG